MTLSNELEIKVDTVVSGTFKDYYEKLKKNLQYMGERLQKFRSQRLDLLNKCKVQPRRASLGYPFHNTAAHMEATPTREGI